MSSYLSGAASTRRTPQRTPIPGREPDQVANSEGGYVFDVGPMERLRRFLILGAEGGTFYIGERELVKENAKVVRDCLDEFGTTAVDEIAEVSRSGRAPKNDEALYALAMAAGHPYVEVRWRALRAIPEVCRTGTHLFQFLGYVQNFRGWGSGLRKAIAGWYEREDVARVAYQAVKYRQREGWTHRDVLRQAHPKPPTQLHDALFKWIVGQDEGATLLFGGNTELRVIEAYQRAQHSPTPAATAALVRQYEGLLPREALRTEHLTDRDVQIAQLEVGMPMTALIRNLANLTRSGAIGPLGKGMTREVVAQIRDRDQLRRARVHPMAILFAESTYASGQGVMGRNTWTPAKEVVDALDDAFHLAFENVVPSEKRTLLCLDVSPSMAHAIRSGTNRDGTPKLASLSCAGGAGALALVTEKVEPWTAAMAFSSAGAGGGRGYRSRYASTGMTPLTISGDKQRVSDVVEEMSRASSQWGMTDCSLPFKYALEEDLDVDVFVVITDNETYAGNEHPVQALRRYREQKGIAAKLVVIGMSSTGFTIADPSDAGMLDVVGFDAAAPAMIADFAAGRV